MTFDISKIDPKYHEVYLTHCFDDNRITEHALSYFECKSCGTYLFETWNDNFYILEWTDLTCNEVLMRDILR